MAHGTRPRVEHDDQGFTLVEVVIAMVILGALAMAMLAIILSAQAQSVSNRGRIAAANLASRELELVRQQFYATDDGPLTVAATTGKNLHPLSGGTVGQPLIVDGGAYTVTTTTKWNVTTTPDMPACQGGSIVVYPTLTVTISVTWEGMGLVKPVVSSGTFAPDKDKGASPSSSYIAVTITDPTTAPLEGVQVSIPGGTPSTAYTDASGCAVVAVTPATGGTAYTVTVSDSRFVDISGQVHSSKTTGGLTAGTIYTGARFTLAKPATLRINVERKDGGTVKASEVAGLSATLVAAEFSGASPITTHALTGLTTVVSGLWPTTYDAYMGATAPTDGYSSVTLASGQTADVVIYYQVLDVTVRDLLAGASKVLAVAAGTANVDCSSGVAGNVSGSSATLSLASGSYDFYLVGSTYGCSPGPAGVAVDENHPTVYWGTSALRVTGAPTTGKIWAVEKYRSGLDSPTGCPTDGDVTGNIADIAVDVSGARSAATSLPAGTWYLFQTSGAADATCMSYPSATNPIVVAYDSTTTVAWQNPTSALTMTSMTNGRYLLLSTATVTACTSSVATSTGTMFTSTAGATGGTSSSTTYVTVPRPGSGTVTYYAYQWQKSGSGSSKCTAAGTYIVGTSTTTLSKTSGSGSVGP